MKKLIAYCILSLTLNSANAELPITIADALKRSGIPQENVAVFVQGLDESSPNITHNASKSMNPASVMKLVTTKVALDELTPTYRWKTEVYRDGNVNNGVLDGNLIFKGYGDPSFKSQELWRLLMSIQQAGIREIRGNLIIDKSVFAEEVGKRITFDNERWRAYNAPPSAFLVSGRNTSFKFLVQENDVIVSQEYELPQVKIINNMKLRLGPCGDWRNYFSYTVKPKDEGVIVNFNGSFSADCEERFLELSLIDDNQYAFATFKKIWHELGGKFNGEVKEQDVPINAVKVSTQFSEPLSNVVQDINKWSNNLMARQLLLTLALEKNATPATEEKGAAVIKQSLQNKGLIFNELLIENGSGLSRTERINAQHLGELLIQAYNSPVMPEFMASLPILGLDGTVKKRLKDSQAKGRAHLKTGSLDGVSAIAGYLLNAQNKRYVLVMLVNHTNAEQSKSAQDALVNAVYTSQFASN